MQTVVGLFAKLNYKVGGASGAGNWTALDVAQDVSVSLTHSEADATTRGSGGWENTEITRRRLSVTWTMLWDTDDAGFQAIREAFLEREMIGLQALDEDGGSGPSGDFKITQFDIGQNMDDVSTVQVTAKVCRSANPPEWN
jgi:hypothetical protein